MSAEPPVPAPVTVELCVACELPWEDHLARATYWTPQDEDDDLSPLVQAIRPVHLGDCLALTKAANRGPEGPQGPQGAMGATGR